MFCIDLRTYSYLPTQYLLIIFITNCLLCGVNWVFKQNELRLVLSANYILCSVTVHKVFCIFKHF